MVLTGEQWHRLANGGFQEPVRIIHLSPEISVHLGVSTTQVYIRPEYIPKLRFKHRVEPRIFEQLPAICFEGAAYLDSRPGTLSVHLYHTIDQTLYRLVLKGIPERNEIWLNTLHPISVSDAKRRQKKAKHIK